MRMLLSASQGGMHNLAGWFYSSNYPITCLDRPFGLQKIEVTEFLDIRHMKVVRLSALSTSRLYPLLPEYTPWYSFLLEAKCTPQPQCGQFFHSVKQVSSAL
jgi:hypothetical protein